VKREQLASAIAIVLTMLLAVRGIYSGGAALLNGTAALLIVTIIVLTIQRLGLVATIALFFVNMITSATLVTLDPSKWFFADSLLLIAMPVAVAFFGFYVSRGGEPLLGRRILA
jgi:hypothetical protein